ncbi:MAG: GspE/PulE family protein [Patescibacteria group bacterium]
MLEGQNTIVKYLLEHGKLTKDYYNELLAEAEKTQSTPDTLLEHKKVISEEDIAWARGQIFAVPVANLYSLVIDRKILEILPKETAENYHVVSFAKEGDTLKVAMLDPGDFKGREAIEFIARQKNLKVEYYAITLSGFKNILTQYGGLSVEVEEAVGAAEDRFAPIIKAGKSIADIGLEEISKMAPIAKLVASILKYAVDNDASDVHIEPLGDQTRIRYRIDGVLREVALLPGHLHSAIISRVKVMANLKLDETRIPQDGRIRVIVSKRQIDLRVSILPLLGQEKTVIRILDPTKKIFDLQDLGFWGRELEIINKNLLRPHGMVLATGPTGSGKTTTLYAILKVLNQPGVNVVTLEDPVEYVLKGVNQSQIQPEIGYTFATGLRSVVRQDPNVIMVGEVRDNETAELATHAALTGHIVLSTLHTNDAMGAIPRLIDMKIEPFLVASSLNIVLAQRLVRKMCPYCAEPIIPPAGVEKDIENALKDVEDIDVEKFRDKKTGHLAIYHSKGCTRCGQEGYKGRIAIFEALEITDQMKDIIVRGCKIDDVKAEFKRQKMISMIQDGYIKTLKGETTIEEVLRVARE